MEKVKVGVVGCGNISSIYFENLINVFVNTEVYACSSLYGESAKAAAEKYNVPHVLTTEELLMNEDIQIVLNLTVPNMHFEISRKALLAGKHVYVEKPLSLTLEQGTELERIAKEKNLMICCAPDTFLGGGLQTCRKMIDDGVIGIPVAATAFMTCHGHESWHPDPEFYYEEGGGPMFDMGPYYITALVSLLGKAKTVCGMTKVSFNQRTITSNKKLGKVIDVKVPTHVAGTMEFENGVIATMITSFDIWSSNLPRIEIYGSLGTLVVPDPNSFGGPILLRLAKENEFKEIPLAFIYGEDSRGIGVADMANCIENGEKPRTSGELANHVLEIMHAFYSSSDTKQYVELKTGCSQPQTLPFGLTKGYVGKITTK